MGLNLTGKKSIWDTIGGALSTAGNAVVSGVKDVGDLGSLGMANLTGNQQAAQHARTAMSANNGNLSNRSLLDNVAGLGHDLGPTAVGAIQFIPQFAENYANTFANLGNKLGGGQDESIQENMGGDPVLNKTLKFSGATGTNRQLASDVAQVGVAAATGGVGKVAEPVIGETGARIVAAGAGNAGFGAASEAGQEGASAKDVAEAGLKSGAAGLALGTGAEAIAAGAANVRQAGRANVLRTAGANTEAQHVPLDSLTSYEGAPDRARVDHYKAKIANGEQLEPIYAMPDSEGNLGVEDGKHRLQAYLESGHTSAPTKVITPEQVHAIAQGGYIGHYEPEDIVDPMQSIHDANPLNPPEPTAPEAAATPEPSQQDLAQSAKAVQAETAPQPVDFTKIEGATQAHADTISRVADELKQQDEAVRGIKAPSDLYARIRQAGGIGSSDFEDLPTHLKRKTGNSMDRVAQELGFESDQALHDAIMNEGDTRTRAKNTPTRSAADYKAAAEKHIRENPDQYGDVARRAEYEAELKRYETANRQSGYNKVRTRNAPAGTPKAIPSYVKEKLNSPEYQAKSAQGAFLQRVRDELPAARAAVKAIDDQLKKLSKSGDINGITALNEQSASARLKLRYLEGQERAQGAEYGRLQRQLDDAYPDVALRKPGTRGKVTVSGGNVRATRPVTVLGRKMSQLDLENAVLAGEITPEEALKQYSSPTARKYLEGEVNKEAKAKGEPEPYNLEEVLGHSLNHEPYAGPNLNEGAFSADDIKELEKMQADQALHVDENGADYSPHYDQTLPANTPELAPRDLRGDTAAFDTLRGGGTMDDAAKAYQEATGASLAEAEKAVNMVAETGADMGTNEEVLRRNPAYGNVNDFEVRDAADADAKARGYSNVLKLKQDRMFHEAQGMSDHDVALLDHLRGNDPESVAQMAEDPHQFLRVADAAKDISDYNHEIRRLHGDATIYRENYGAGMHYAVNTPDDLAAISGYRDQLASTPGFSRERIIGDYDKANSQYDLNRKNNNFLEDVQNDARQTVNYVHDRAVFRSLQESHGANAVTYGAADFDHPKQLNGTRNVYGTREVAKEWDRLNPQRTESRGLTRAAEKTYDTATSGITQLIMVNPLFHGANLLNQAYIAVGKTDPGGAHFLTNLKLTPEEAAAIDDRRFQAGDHRPTYGSEQHGIISQMTGGITDLNKKAMSAIDNDLRRATFKTLTDGGMEDREAVRTVDKFMGDKTAIGAATRRFTIFFKFFKTMLGALVETPKDPGTLLNAALAAGLVYGVNKAFQEWTGNKHAHTHIPGEIGIAKDIITSGKDVAEGHYGQATGIVTNRVNPIAKEAGQQLFDRDLFTGKSLEDSGGRGGHLTSSLVAQGQGINSVQDESKSAAEAVANAFGIYTPHVKTAPAAPSGRADFLNRQTVQENGQTVKVKAAEGADPTGVDQRNSYFQTVEEAKKTLPHARQKVYDQLVAGTTDPDGNPIGMNDKQAQARYGAMYANPDVLKAIVKQKQAYAKATGSEVDPLYSDQITDEQRLEYAHLQSMPYKGDDYIQQSVDPATGKETSWLKDLTTARVAYFAKQDFAGSPPSERVAPPSFDDQTQADMNTASGLDGAEKAQFIQDHPDIQNAYDAIAKYTNDRRVAQGNAPFKLFPKADPQTQADINTYMGLGTKAAKSAWIKANQGAWQGIQKYFSSEAEWELANSAGQDKYQGATPSQQELKATYSLGNYDIAKDPNTGVYSLDPTSPNTASASEYAKNKARTSSYSKANSFARTARSAYSHNKNPHPMHVRTLAQNRNANPRPRKSRSRMVRITRIPGPTPPSTGKLRVKSATIA